MSKKSVGDAVFFKGNGKPRCEKCQSSLDEIKIVDYGVENDTLFFVSPCTTCEKLHKYFTDEDHRIIKTKIVERNAKK